MICEIRLLKQYSVYAILAPSTSSCHFLKFAMSFSYPTSLVEHAPSPPAMFHSSRRLEVDRVALAVGVVAIVLAIFLTIAWLVCRYREHGSDLGLARDNSKQGARYLNEVDYDGEEGRNEDLRVRYGGETGNGQRSGVQRIESYNLPEEYRGQREDNDIYNDTMGPGGSQRWDWVDRATEDVDYTGRRDL